MSGRRIEHRRYGLTGIDTAGQMPELADRRGLRLMALLGEACLGSAQDTLRFNEEFHFLVYALTGSETLLDMIEMLWSRSGPYLASVVTLDGTMSVFQKAFHMHESIIADIEKGDAPNAQRVLVADITFAVEWYEDKRANRAKT